MPEMTPVAAQIQPLDPMKGIGTLSGMIGIQQQRQALQTGQYEQQTAQAGAQQAQQKSAELQQAQAIALQGVQSGKYTSTDGTLDRTKLADDITRVAPTYGGEISHNLLSQANEMVQNKTALQNLNENQQKQIGDGLQALATKKDLSNSDVIDFLDQASDRNPQLRRTALSLASHLPPNASPQQLQQIMGQLSSQMTGTSPVTPTQTDTGAAVQGGTQNRFTGALSPAGPGIRKTLGPTDQPGYKRQVAAASTEGGAGAANDEALYNEITQKGTQATKLKALTQDIQSLAGEVQTGQYSKAFADKWSALKQTFGFRPDDNSADTKRQILTKMAAQLKAQSESGASTDAARAGIEASLPDPEHMGPAAVQQAARYVGSLTDIDAARARLAQQHRQVAGGQSTGLRQADSAFMQNADPRVFEYQSIPAGQERQNYLKQHFKSKEEVQAFLDKQKALRSYGAVQ